MRPHSSGGAAAVRSSLQRYAHAPAPSAAAVTDGAPRPHLALLRGRTATAATVTVTAAAMATAPTTVAPPPTAAPTATDDAARGVSLRRRLRQSGPLSPSETLSLLDAIAGDIDAAHSRGQVHGAIAPESVWILPGGQPKLYFPADSRRGAIGTAPAAPSLPASLRPVGYLSPEERRGEPPTPATDIWVLGVLICELLTGRAPQPVESPAASLPSILPDAARAAAPVLGRALAGPPAVRYPSARAFVASLREALTGSAPPPAFADRPRLVFGPAARGAARA